MHAPQEEYHSGSSDTALRTRILRAQTLLRDICCTVSSILTLSLGLHPQMQAAAVRSVPYIPPSIQAADHASQPAEPNGLILIGFMGGRIKGDNFLHVEARMAKDLQQRYPRVVHAAVFANHDGHLALKSLLQLLDRNKDGRLSVEEKAAARIIIFGHSWGASETIALARRLDQLNIPVLLTVQVDSVQKSHQNDGSIPPNVREAINFYQSEGMLHGRNFIQAMDPEKTTILGNYESTYRKNPISCAGYPWFARAFMKPHIEIENDASVWSRIEALIRAKVLEGESPAETTRLQPGDDLRLLLTQAHKAH
jgi:hypothetical protein